MRATARPETRVSAAGPGVDTTLVTGEVRIAGQLDARFFELLAAIDATGSINKAARTAGYSYKGAWLLLDTAARLASEPLVDSATGGRGGGGTRLTAAARGLIDAWRGVEAAHRDFLRLQEALLSSHPALAANLKRMSMKITARNQFAGQIATVEVGPVTTQATLTLHGGHEITATMTTAAAKRLKLKKGQDAIALVKASEVMLVTDFAGYVLSARNQLAGTVSRLEKGAVSSLVGVTLPGGSVITASVTNDAVEALGLAVGQDATAVFKAYAVMVAVAGR